jgi:hypothetical protein
VTWLLRHLRRRAADERGAALIFVAVGLPVFVAFGIFVMDVGNWWVHKRHLQIQADAAALAGAREFSFPACSDQAIVEEAVDYSGGVLTDPDVNFSGFDIDPLFYNHQLAATARPLGPTQGLYTQVNTPDPYNRGGDGSPIDADLAAMAVADRKPCTSQMVDVKMTETDLPGRFSPLRFLNVLGFIDFIDARARVELRALEQTTDLLPLAVEDLNPKRVHVWLYDEDTQELLGEAELMPDGNEDGLLMYDNSVTSGGTPMAVDFRRETINGHDVTKQRVGAVVGFSGSDSINCADPGVECYGTAADGVTRIRGSRTTEGTDPASCADGVDNDGDGTLDATGANHDPDCRGVRLGAVSIIKDTCGVYAAHENGFFSTTCTDATMTVDLPGFDNDATNSNNRQVTARIHSGNGDSAVDLHWDAGTGLWKTTGTDRLPIELAAGTQSIDIEWSQRKNNSFLDMGGATPAVCKSAQSQNPCQGTFTNAHKTFSGTRAVSGPLKEVRVDVAPDVNVNNVQRCAANQTCPHAIVVRVGLAGRLELTPPDSPPVGLRISASGPEFTQTQQLNCQPSGPQWTPRNTDQEFAYGCEPMYGIKEDPEPPCPSKAELHGSPNPPAWECVAVKTGEMNGPVGAGLNERILCVPPNPASNCDGHFGKPQSCTSPNRYPNIVDGDPRLLALFLVPYGSLEIAGSGSTVPIINFAYFYVTGWHSKGGGFDNPCADPNAPIPDVFAPDSDPNDSGVVSGYWVKPVVFNSGGGGEEACNPNTIGGCVAVMTK